MISLILLGSIQCILLFLFVSMKKNKTTEDYILMSLLAYFSLTFGFIYFAEAISKPHLTAYLLNSGLLAAGLFALYIQRLLDPTPGFKPAYLIHFVPYLATLVFLVSFYLIAERGRYTSASFYSFIHEYGWIHDMFRIINIAIGPLYAGFIIYIFRTYRKSEQQVFSTAKETEKTWIKSIVFISVLLWFLTALVNKVISVWLFPGLSHIYEITWGLSALLFVYMCYQGFKHRPVYFNLPDEPASIDDKKSKGRKYERSGLREVDFDKMAKRISSYMEEKKPYLNPNLTIYDLAAELEMPPYQLSQILNEYFRINFYYFINRYRIDEFKRVSLLDENNKYSIQSIAFDCGFNSRATFYRIFKEMTGQTPSQFMGSEMKR